MREETSLSTAKNHLYMCELTAEQSLYATETLNEDPNKRDDNIEEIRNWIISCEDICSRTGKNLMYFLL